MQREIIESAYKYQREVEKKKRIVVGVNKFEAKKDVPIKILRVNPTVEEKVVERLKRVKKERDNRKVEEVLDRLRHMAEEETENLVPPILDAAKEYATVGEICSVLREIYGEHKPLTIF
jgi:methylmalonyl-CoA mutase N-terminal domain/subunit